MVGRPKDKDALAANQVNMVQAVTTEVRAHIPSVLMQLYAQAAAGPEYE